MDAIRDSLLQLIIATKAECDRRLAAGNAGIVLTVSANANYPQLSFGCCYGGNILLWDEACHNKSVPIIEAADDFVKSLLTRIAAADKLTCSYGGRDDVN